MSAAAPAMNGYTYDDAMSLGLNLSLVLGPLVIASMINTFVYGICVMQFYEYFFARFHDGWKTTSFVIYLALLDTFAVCLNASLIWYYTVHGFGDVTVIGSTPWMYNIVPVLSVMASCPIQHFLGWRVKRLTKSWIIFGVISTVSLVSAVCGIVATALALQVGKVANNTNLLPFADTWLAAATACDIGVTCMLLIFLTKSRTGFRKTNSLIEHLIKVSLESAVPVTIFTVCDLAILTTMPTSNVHMLFALGMGRVYTNAVLTTLNARLKYQIGSTQESSTNNHQTIKLSQYSHGPQTQVRIDVQQDTMGDTAGFQKRTDPASGVDYGMQGSSDGLDTKAHVV